LERKAEALRWFKELEKLGAATDGDYVYQADYLYRLNEDAAAAEIYEALANKPQQASGRPTFKLWYWAAFSRWYAGHADAALAAARQCVAAAATQQNSATEVAKAHTLIATVLNGRGVYDQAINAARQSITLNPKDAWPYTQLAIALNGAARPSEAESAAKTALALSDGKSPPPQNLWVGDQ